MKRGELKKKRFADEQVVRILRKAENKLGLLRKVCKRHSIAKQAFLSWRSQLGSLAAN